jgi:predicted CopG family antitoxin
MISIPITEEAYEALKARIPRIDQAPTSISRNGQMRILVDRKIVDWLLELRGPGESYSDVIIRLAEEAGGSAE